VPLTIATLLNAVTMCGSSPAGDESIAICKGAPESASAKPFSTRPQAIVSVASAMSPAHRRLTDIDFLFGGEHPI